MAHIRFYPQYTNTTWIVRIVRLHYNINFITEFSATADKLLAYEETEITLTMGRVWRLLIDSVCVVFFLVLIYYGICLASFLLLVYYKK